MANVVAYVRSRSGHRRTRSSLDNRVAHVYDEKFTTARAGTLRQRALADEEDELVVSSPKDKNFCSAPWDTLKDRKSEEFSPTATPFSDGPRTPSSAEYARFRDRSAFEQPKPAHPMIQTEGHRRTMSTPVVNSEAPLSAGRKSSFLLKGRPSLMSNSEPSPQTGSFPTINELNDSLSETGTQKPLPPDPLPLSRPRPDSATIPIHRKPLRSIDILEHHSQLLQQQQQQQQQQNPPPTQKQQQKPPPPPPKIHLSSLPVTKVSKPTHIDLPPPPSLRRLNLPSELHIHTPEYTDALRQWFPAMANASVRKEGKNVELVVGVEMDVGVCT